MALARCMRLGMSGLVYAVLASVAVFCRYSRWRLAAGGWRLAGQRE
jgi:hypothetical protein